MDINTFIKVRFNSTLVRLIASGLIPSIGYSTFQFHFGTIDREPEICKWCAFRCFNSTLVRLIASPVKGNIIYT